MKTFAAAALLLPTLAAQAGEVYTQVGFPGAMLGYAHSLGEHWAVRGDLATVGRRSETRDEAGIRYDARLRSYRAGLFADWFAFAGGFRVTGGLTFNDYRLALQGRSVGGNITIGDNTYPTTTDDRFDVALKVSSPTPYIGIGWGHQAGSGWRFVADLGVMYGRAKLNASLGGQLASQVRQSDIDKELDQLRDAVLPYRWLPQATIGIGYAF